MLGWAQIFYQTIPDPRELGKVLLAKNVISLPDAIPCRNVNVDTGKKLISKINNKKIQVVIPKK
jgi:hypothetical protein